MTMTKEQIESLKTAIQGILSATSGKSIDEAGLAFWILALKDYDYNDVRQALIEWAETQKFAPKPSEIVAAVKMKIIVRKDQAMTKQRHESENGNAELDLRYMQKITAMFPTYEGRARALKAREERGEFIAPIHQYWWRRVLREA